jgi:flagella basal body P-ring formation protein FlgA
VKGKRPKVKNSNPELRTFIGGISMIRWIVAFLVCLLGFPSMVFGFEIRFKESAVAKGETITLAEVADLSPACATVQALKGQTLFHAPAPGEDAIYKADAIKTYLLQIDSGLQSARWSGAQEIRVKRAGIAIGPDKIHKIIDSFLQEKRAFLPQAQIRFKPLSLPMPFVLPKGKLSYEVIPSDPQILGSRRFTLIFRVDGRVVENRAIRGELEAIAPVAIAAIDLRRGAVLASRDVQLASFDLAQLRNPCLNLNELIGKRIKRSVKLGEPIARDIVEFPPMVKRGEVVTISARSGGLHITATGVAQRNGKEGELIKVRNTSSGRDILCKVSAQGEVEVEF